MRGSPEPASSVPYLTFDHPAEENVERREASGLHSFLPTLSLFSVSEAHSKDLHKAVDIANVVDIAGRYCECCRY